MLVRHCSRSLTRIWPRFGYCCLCPAKSTFPFRRLFVARKNTATQNKNFSENETVKIELITRRTQCFALYSSILHLMRGEPPFYAWNGIFLFIFISDQQFASDGDSVYLFVVWFSSDWKYCGKFGVKSVTTATKKYQQIDVNGLQLTIYNM